MGKVSAGKCVILASGITSLAAQYAHAATCTQDSARGVWSAYVETDQILWFKNVADVNVVPVRKFQCQLTVNGLGAISSTTCSNQSGASSRRLTSGNLKLVPGKVCAFKGSFVLDVVNNGQGFFEDSKSFSLGNATMTNGKAYVQGIGRVNTSKPGDFSISIIFLNF